MMRCFCVRILLNQNQQSGFGMAPKYCRIFPGIKSKWNVRERGKKNIHHLKINKKKKHKKTNESQTNTKIIFVPIVKCLTGHSHGTWKLCVVFVFVCMMKIRCCVDDRSHWARANDEINIWTHSGHPKGNNIKQTNATCIIWLLFQNNNIISIDRPEWDSFYYGNCSSVWPQNHFITFEYTHIHARIYIVWENRRERWPLSPTDDGTYWF